MKREPGGLASNLLHDIVQEGDIISSMPPAGSFTLEYSARPVVLISAGIGVTPMVSMLHQLANDGGERDVTFIHGARDGAYHALAAEVREIAGRLERVRLHVAYSRPRDADRPGLDYDSAGRVDGVLISRLVEVGDDADYYVCGPTPFMADVAAALDDLGITLERVHTESFGPSALPA